MNLATYIARRLSFNRQQSFSRFIIRLAITATSISVGAMLLTFAFTNGFQFAISHKIFSFWGNIRVQHFEGKKSSIAEESPITKNDTIYRMLQANPDIKTVQAFATKTAVIKGPESIEGVLLKGVEKEYDFENLRVFLQSGRWINFPYSGYSSEINLSTYTANELKLHLQDKVIIYFIQPDGSHRARPMVLVGTYKTGIEDYDKSIAIGDIRLIRRLNNWGAGDIGGYEIFLKDYRKMEMVNNAIFNELPQSWNSRTIKQLPQAEGIFEWLNLQNTTIAIVLIIMIIVATLNLVTCLIILLLERTHMVGILKSLGSPDRVVQRIFLYQGAIITLVGISAGNILALLISWLQSRYGFITLPEDSYYISTAIVRLEWWHFIFVNTGTFLICFTVLLIPTLIIRKMEPVRAIRFE